MAIALTLKDSGSSGFTYNSSSFTPSNNSLLVVAIHASTFSTFYPVFSVSGGGLTWTKLTTQNAGGNYPIHDEIWTAPVTTGASMFVQVVLSSGVANLDGNSTSVSVTEVTGHDTVGGWFGLQAGVAAPNGTAHSGPLTLSLDGATASDSVVFSSLTSDGDYGDGPVTPTAGYTALLTFQGGTSGWFKSNDQYKAGVLTNADFGSWTDAWGHAAYGFEIRAAGGGGLAIDGSVHQASYGTGTMVFPGLTTTQSNDYIIVTLKVDNGFTVTGVAGSTLGAFTQISVTVNGQWREYIFAKFSSGTLSSEVITATFSTASINCAGDAFGVSGSGQTSLVWDANGPVTTTTAATSTTFTPAQATETMVLGGFHINGGAYGSNSIPGPNFTNVCSPAQHHAHVTQYRIVKSTATQTLSVSLGTPFETSIVVGIPRAVSGGATLTASNLANSAPTLGPATLTKYALPIAGETTGSPVLGAPALAIAAAAPLTLYDYTLDFGLEAFLLANKIVVCSDLPTTYTEANSTYKIGEKTFSAAGPVSLALDGHVHAVNTTGGPLTFALPGLTTTQAGDIIVVHVWTTGGTITSITGATLGAFTYIGGSAANAAGEHLRVYAAFASAALTGEVITATQIQQYDMRYTVAAWSGTNQTSLTGAFETFIANELGAFNGCMPQNYTTTHANAVVVGFTTIGFSGNATAANNGFSLIGTPANNIVSLYKVLSATGTQSISHDQDSTSNHMVGYAIIQSTGIPASPVFVPGHSLLTNMLACYLPGVYGGVPVAGTGPTLANGAGGAGTVVSTAEGPALRSNTLGAAKGLVATAPSAFKAWTNFTILWRGVIIGAGDAFCPLLGVSSTSSDVAPYFMINSATTGSGYAQLQAFYGDSGTMEVTPSSDVTGQYGSIIDIAVTATVGGNVTFYVNGVSVGSNTMSVISTSDATAKIVVNQGIDATSRSPNASCNMACFWDRALSPAEILGLHSSPYAFLQSPGSVITAGPQDATPTGRQVVTAAVTGGTVTTNGTPLFWAIVDDANSRLLAAGDMTGSVAVTTADGWSLDAMTINVP